MTFIFYALFFLVGVLHEMESLFSPKSVLEKQVRVKEFNVAKKLDPKLRASSDTLGVMFMDVMYFFLTFIGVMTSQWLVFIVLILMGFVPKKWKAVIFIDALVSLILIVFIIINKYHLQIDLTQVFLSLF